MKKITELSEKEILDLTIEDVELMIKLKKAEEGIKLLPKPKEPIYFDIKAPDVVVYSCILFGDNLVFEDIEELNKVINVIKNTASKYRLEYNWNKLSSDFKYATKELKPRCLGSKNSHCVYKSIGLLVTGEPVNILLYLAIFLNFNKFLVLFAL